MYPFPMTAWSQNRPDNTPAFTSRSWGLSEPSASVAASKDSWMARGGTLANTVCLACRQSGSVGFSSGQAVGSQRSARRRSWAHRRLAPAVCGEPLSRKSTMDHPRQWLRIAPKNCWTAHWSHRRLSPSSRSPLFGFKAPYQDALRPIAGDGHSSLLSLEGPRGAQRGRLRNDGLVHEQDHRPPSSLQAPLEPPFAWRQCGARRASTYRGRL